MATILLQAAGAFLGGFLGTTGAAIGTAAGALAGYVVDRSLINATRRYEGPRLQRMGAFGAEDGEALARLYGTARLPGTVIWATRFEEDATTRRQGSKGGPRVTEFSYFANVAFALCEGEIAGVRRVWADGKEVDLSAVEMRVHRGGEDQPPDPLIEARQGNGVPAFRGTAYVVFERLPIGPYGNRVPQMQFEVMRPVGALEKRVRAVALIPGATEFGLSPQRLNRSVQPGVAEVVNRHILHGETDFTAAIDELQSLCPALEHVALVISWFGDDLRCGHCRIRPGVTQPSDAGFAAAWRGGGLSRSAAWLVTQVSGRPAYGGTPDDRSVIDAIAALKARGLKVTLYPFVMMDIPAGNALPDPYGGASQAAYPWRGRLTCHPAPGRPGSPDASLGARAQVEAFFGSAVLGHFTSVGGQIVYSGSPADFGYRRFLLHCAKLVQAAGGVDTFLIGSELRGLTTIRGEERSYPAVEALCELAGDVRAMLGPDTALTYAADWSEYFGHQPSDGSQDVSFHLDPLWAHPAINAVGIDNYMPLSDWRDSDHDGSNPDGASGPCDAAALQRAIAGGEGHDWYYPDSSARETRSRVPITDGAGGKPWVFRPKDLAAWWSNQHFDRIGGVEAGLPSAWVPCSKPIWFTELGCPAVDKGANQPNVFPDPKSDESRTPHHSSGGRSDLAQRRFLDAHLNHWANEDDPALGERNPVSALYSGRMVDRRRIYLWAWDCRPFPAFPQMESVWGDGANWATGHWLNGRLGSVSVEDVLKSVLADHGIEGVDATGAGGTLTGFVVTEPGSARAALEPLLDLFGLVASETPEGLVIRTASSTGPALLRPVLALENDRPAISRERIPDHDFADTASVTARDPMRDYQAGTALAARPGNSESRTVEIGLSGTLDMAFARALAEDWLYRQWRSRDSMAVALPASDLEVAAGTIIRAGTDPAWGDFLVTEVEEGMVRRIQARRIDRAPETPVAAGVVTMQRRATEPVAPEVHFLDLPMGEAEEPAASRLLVSAWSRPWRSQIVYASPAADGFEQRATLPRHGTVGRLIEGLFPATSSGRLMAGRFVDVRLSGGALESVSVSRLLNGANGAAVRADNGAWEIMQFQWAEEIADRHWRLTGLLRGQLGTEDAAEAGSGAGAAFVLLDETLRPAGLRAGEAGLALNWRVGPAGAPLQADIFTLQSLEGGRRALMPLAPVHLRWTKMSGDDLRLDWVRRGRIAADGWEGADIPLGEESQAYSVEVRAASGELLRTATSGQPMWFYDAVSRAEDLAASAEGVTVEVRQIGALPGIPASITLD